MNNIHKNFLIDSSGSITVLSVFLLPIMFLLVTVIVCVGQLIFEKIRLQNVADACVLSAASVQSVGLNEIADLNYEMSIEFRKLKNILSRGLWFNKNEGKEVIIFFREVFYYIHQYMDEANNHFAKLAIEIANDVIKSNTPKNRNWSQIVNAKTELARYYKEVKQVGFSYVAEGCYRCSLRRTISWNASQVGTPAYSGNHDGTFRSSRRVMRIDKYEAKVQTVVEKDSSYVIDFEVTLKQSPANYSLGKGIFGKMPELRAYAKAKPTGGNIHKKKPAYRPVLLE